MNENIKDRMTPRDALRLSRYQQIIALCQQSKTRYQIAEIIDAGIETVYADCKYLISKGFMKSHKEKLSKLVKEYGVYLSLIETYPDSDFVPSSMLRTKEIQRQGKRIGGDTRRTQEQVKVENEALPNARVFTPESLAEKLLATSRLTRSEYKSAKNTASSNTMAMF